MARRGKATKGHVRASALQGVFLGFGLLSVDCVAIIGG